jgi:RimJ/RimL family protein N-acetyltransferase
MKHFFYRYDYVIGSQFPEKVSIDKRFNAVSWKPTALEIVPNGVALLPFGVWWTMHHLHLFMNQDYSLYLIYDSHNLIYRSVITPGYFRFPFMGKEDLQIGDTWTMPEYRRKGLASFAIQKIVELHKKPGRRFWYVVEENNIPSIRAVKKAGFVKYGVGARRKRIGVALFGFFEIQQKFL